MKITFVVLFLAGLTIYCKNAIVLSLPPSLFANAASLESALAQKSLPKDSRTEAIANAQDENGIGVMRGHEGGDFSDGTVNSQVLYNNFQNMLQQSFGIHKRERANAYEDDKHLGAQAAGRTLTQLFLQPQLHQKGEAINNNNNNKHLKVKPSPRQLHTTTGDDANALKTKASVTLLPQSGFNAAADYDFSKWLDDGASGSKILTSGFVRLPYNGWPIDEANSKDGIKIDKLSSHRFFPATDEYKEDDIGDDYGDGDGDGDRDGDGDGDGDGNGDGDGYETEGDVDEDDEDAIAADDGGRPVVWSKFIRPLNNSPNECLGETICPMEYYLKLLSDRDNALSRYMKNASFVDDEQSSSLGLHGPREISQPVTTHTFSDINDDDIVLLLTAEQELEKFLAWALAELQLFGKLPKVGEYNADHYEPGMYLRKTLNLSGRLEPPLLVEEPGYVIVRREYDPEEDAKRGGRVHYHDDPFIPPRGRKHNLPDLDALLQRYETFVPNRGRRDKIRDIFKYDDVFYPNRGKRQITIATADNIHDNDYNDNININKARQQQRQPRQQQQRQQQHQQQQREMAIYEMQLNQHPLTKTLEQIKNVIAKMRRKLQVQQLQQENDVAANTFVKLMSNKKPTAETSTTNQRQQYQLRKRFKPMINILQQQRRQHQLNKNLNSRRQWWKRYSTMDGIHTRWSALAPPALASASTSASAPAPASTMRARRLASNRLHALRSMSSQQKLKSNEIRPAGAAAMSHPKQQPQYYEIQYANEYVSPPRHYQPNKVLWQAQQSYNNNNKQGQSTPSDVSQLDFDPSPWHKLQILQHQYHLPLLAMRHPRRLSQQQQYGHVAWLQRHNTNADQHQQQLAMAPETQLPSHQQHSSIDPISLANDNAMVNDLKTLYDINFN